MPALDLEQRDLDAGCCLISVKGELDLAVAAQLDTAIEKIETSAVGLVIGLGECEFIDSTGIAVIIRAHQRFAAAGGRLVVCCPAGQVERILDITGIADDGLIYESLEQAISALKATEDS